MQTNMNTPVSSRAALRRLLIVLVTVIGFLIYAYGWTVTNIDLSKPQEATRGQNVTNALRELLSPRIFEQDRELVPARVSILVDCEKGTMPEPVDPPATEPYVIVTPACASSGDVVTVQAFNYAADAEARIRWIPLEGQSRPREVVETGRQEITLDASGGFIGQIEVPRISGSSGQIHEIEFVAATPSGSVRLSNTANEVLRRMAETIFMALMATSLAIPISVVLSFFAAHNLMRPIRIPLGNLLVMVIMLPVGYWLGTLVLSAIARVGLDLASGQLLTSTAMLPLVLMAGTTAAARSMPGLQPDNFLDNIRAVAIRLAVVAGLVFALGLLGGLGMLGSQQFANLAAAIRPAEVDSVISWLVNALADGIGGFGAMIGILGGLVDIFIVPVTGVIGAFTLASIVTQFTTAPLRQVSGIMNYVLGAVLGAGGGAVVMGVVGSIGMITSLFGLLPPLIAGEFGGGIGLLIYHRLRGEQIVMSSFDRFLRSLLSIVGAIAAFVFTFIFLNVSRALIDGTLPSAATTSFLGLTLPVYVAQAALIGLVLGAISGGMAGIRSQFMIGDVLYNITRNVLNALRSIEPLIMGLIFVVWVGIGPFAGVLALTLHSIASLGKLYSEQIETIDAGPIEALKSTGANQLQTIIYAVVPQIVPPYIAFTMYRWDINVRMSTIIGFVGGGGIGLLLNQQINLLRYRDAGVAVLAIALVVSILDYASAKIREQVI